MTTRKRIMIVDDSKFWRRIVTNTLTKANYEVVAEASDGIEALDLYYKFRPDLITLDIIMPKQSGIETIKEILDFDPTAKIIVMTALGHSPVVKRALNMGVKEVLVKPVQLDDLLAAVDYVFSNGRYP